MGWRFYGLWDCKFLQRRDDLMKLQEAGCIKTIKVVAYLDPNEILA